MDFIDCLGCFNIDFTYVKKLLRANFFPVPFFSLKHDNMNCVYIFI